MFIVLIIILTVISISLRIGASGLELVEKVSGRVQSDSKENTGKLSGVVKFGLTTSASFMKVSAFIVARIRDLIGVSGMLAVIVGIVIFLVATVSAASFMSIFTTTDESGHVDWSEEAKIMMQGSSSGLVDNSVASTGSSSTGVSISSPSNLEGITEESWNSADSYGKAIASFAANAVLNPPNGKPMQYDNVNRDTPVGTFDCITFTEAVLQGSVGKTIKGKDTTKGFDFNKDTKMDIVTRISSGELWDMVKGRPDCVIGKSNSDMGSAQPGDLLVREGHVGIYVGKNADGKHVLVHASSAKGWCEDNPTLKPDGNLEVGFSDVAYSKNKELTIVRTSKFLGLS